MATAGRQQRDDEPRRLECRFIGMKTKSKVANVSRSKTELINMDYRALSEILKGNDVRCELFDEAYYPLPEAGELVLATKHDQAGRPPDFVSSR